MVAVIDSSALTVPASSTGDEVWVGIARGYAEFGSPLVPSREDIGIYEKVAARHVAASGRGGLDALMLGVTPGIATMQWPERSRVLAVEISPEVIRALWPGDIRGVREACCASWFDLPAGRDSLDLIVGDGSLNARRYPDEVRALSRCFSAALRRDGVLAVRAYVRPETQETIEGVFSALFSPDGLKVDVFKMRLWLAMQQSAREGVRVRDAARVLDRFGVDRQVMKRHFGWKDAAIEPFEKWRDSNAVYSFPSIGELRAVLGECFREISVTFPAYELGNCCPVLVARSNGRGSVQGGS